MKFFDTCGSITDDDFKKYVGLSRISLFPKSKHFLRTYVSQNEQYRPDLISYRLFESVNYSWVLDEMNNFYHGFKEYTSGREIFYLRKEDLRDLGFIR
jgi:hypothetical protein